MSRQRLHLHWNDKNKISIYLRILGIFHNFAVPTIFDQSLKDFLELKIMEHLYFLNLKESVGLWNGKQREAQYELLWYFLLFQRGFQPPPDLHDISRGRLSRWAGWSSGLILLLIWLYWPHQPGWAHTITNISQQMDNPTRLMENQAM